MKITPAQLQTLNMTRDGVVYQLRGDGLKGRMVFKMDNGMGMDYKNAPSLPPLYRNGLIEMTCLKVTTKTLYYSVKLTEKGKELL